MNTDQVHLAADGGPHGPAQEPRFQWCCAKGCGSCDVKCIDFEYSRTETVGGELLESKTVPRLVSACCGATLFMWDNERECDIDVDIDNIAPNVPSLQDCIDTCARIEFHDAHRRCTEALRDLIYPPESIGGWLACTDDVSDTHAAQVLEGRSLEEIRSDVADLHRRIQLRGRDGVTADGATSENAVGTPASPEPNDKGAAS